MLKFLKLIFAWIFGKKSFVFFDTYCFTNLRAEARNRVVDLYRNTIIKTTDWYKHDLKDFVDKLIAAGFINIKIPEAQFKNWRLGSTIDYVADVDVKKFIGETTDPYFSLFLKSNLKVNFTRITVKKEQAMARACIDPKVAYASGGICVHYSEEALKEASKVERDENGERKENKFITAINKIGDMIDSFEAKVSHDVTYTLNTVYQRLITDDMLNSFFFTEGRDIKFSVQGVMVSDLQENFAEYDISKKVDINLELKQRMQELYKKKGIVTPYTDIDEQDIKEQAEQTKKNLDNVSQGIADTIEDDLKKMRDSNGTEAPDQPTK